MADEQIDSKMQLEQDNIPSLNNTNNKKIPNLKYAKQNASNKNSHFQN